MFGKLLKYDFRSMLKQFAFIWPAALALALVNRFTLDSFGSGRSMVGTSVGIFAIIAFVSVMVAMFVVALIFVIQRFYRGLLGDEGYLMHTLPVRTWQLIASKLTCAVVVTVVSGLVAFLAILLLTPLTMEDILDLFPNFWKLLGETNFHFVLYAIETLILGLVTCAAGYLHLYLAMALGHLANRHRAAMSVIAYIGINILLSILMNLLFHMDFHINIRLDDLLGKYGVIHFALWLWIGLTLLLDAVYFFCTDYILRKNLNLE